MSSSPIQPRNDRETTAPQRCGGPIDRRSFLQLGTLGLGGLSLADALRLRAMAGNDDRAAHDDTAVIFVWLPGGPPHLDMYDMKPEAPAEYRGAFTPIATRVPGIDVCELMPLHAACSDKYTVIRSIAHNFADHGGGHKRFMTARDPLEPTGFVNDLPAAPSFVAKCREGQRRGLPNYISFTDGGREGVDVFSFGAAYLGPSYVPFAIPGDPVQPSFSVPNIALDQALSDRLDDRLTPLNGFDQIRRSIDRSGTMEAVDEFQRRATEMLTSTATRDAFDLSRETDATKTRYGRHAWGYRLMLARRLVEAGCSFATVVVENPYQSGVEWLAVTALIEDLYARGLDRRVLLVVTGEFGRTPRVENVKGSQTGTVQPGRDHWPNSMSLIVSGGGLKMGQAVGSTTAKGEVPKDRPLTPNDLWATIYRHLGIDAERAFPDYRGRPMPILPYGKPIAELM
ncbi:MAG: DUF1501 domain-containing protein [Planctomycetota bacterium]|nr:DUF1501 domain-containing protein [Planctomycetota bacterium]